jgi:hypothetical protein
MKLLPKLVIAAFGVAGVTQAQANILVGNSADLFLSVYDEVGQQSYIRDLGINIANFLPTSTSVPVDSAAGSGVDYAFGATVSNGTGSVLSSGYQLTFGVDPVLTGLLTSASGRLNTLTWNIGAIDNNTFGNSIKFLSTTNASPDSIGTLTNDALNQFTASATYVTQSNNKATNSTQTNGSSLAAPADQQAYFPTVYGSDWGGKANFVSTAGLGQSLNFVLLAPNGPTPSSLINVSPFASVANGNVGSWLLSDNGSLVYSVAAIPEPSTYAMLGAGLLMLGAIARRRLQDCSSPRGAPRTAALALPPRRSTRRGKPEHQAE